MIVETALRVSGDKYLPPLIVCNEQHRFSVADMLLTVGIRPRTILLEPEARNTAPAISAAAFRVMADDPDGLMLVLPSDHVVADEEGFQDAVARATRLATAGHLVTFGITPTRPETGYGYIKAGAAIEGVPGAARVATFKEKPDLATAQGYLEEGGYFWNGGIFMFPARLILQEIETFEPTVAAAACAAVAAGTNDLDFFRLDRDAFLAGPNVSVDVAVMERTRRAAVVQADIGWSDIGSWAALWETGRQDEDRNVYSGDVIMHDVRRSYIRSDGGKLIAAVGVSDLVVVATDDAVLVTTRAGAQDVKAVVDRIHCSRRTEHMLHSTVHRPWGTYRTIDSGPRFHVKQITVKPGAQLSLQYHLYRAEHWVVVEGTARVTRGDEVFLLHENQSAFIPAGAVHRLENPGIQPLRLIEVQSGSYLGEDDIVRLDDAYGRTADRSFRHAAGGSSR